MGVEEGPFFRVESFAVEIRVVVEGDALDDGAAAADGILLGGMGGVHVVEEREHGLGRVTDQDAVHDADQARPRRVEAERASEGRGGGEVLGREVVQVELLPINKHV